jgi:hypothetical protein
MDELDRVDFGAVLMDWALHEWRGRIRVTLAPSAAEQAAGLPPELTKWNAARALLKNRRDVIAGLMHAGIIRCMKIRVTAADIPSMLVMGADPVSNYSRKKLAEVDTDGSADYVRGLAVSTMHVAGPFLAIARTTAGPVTMFDGMHRIAAWVAHVQAGREYPLEISLVLTERPSPVFELPVAQ